MPIVKPDQPAEARLRRSATSHRMATPEELEYLRRFNLIRLLRYVMFWFNLVFFAGLSFFLTGYVASFALAVEAVGLGLFLAGVSALLGFVTCVWIWQIFPQFLQVRPWLKIPDDVEVFGLSDTLAIQHLHPSLTTDIYTFFGHQIYVDLPDHWMDSFRKERESAEDEHVFEVAHIPGATDAIYWQKTLARNGGGMIRRVDFVITDFGSHILKLGACSIAADIKAQLPILRAHSSIARLAVSGASLLVFATLVSCAFFIVSQDYLDYLRREADEVLPIQRELPIATLEARGITGLRPDPELGTRLVHGDETLKVVRVKRHRQDRAVLLTEDEFDVVRMALGPGASLRWQPIRIQRLAQLQDVAERVAAGSPELESRVRDLSLTEDIDHSKSRGYCGVIQSYLAAHWPEVELVRRDGVWNDTVVLLRRDCLPMDTRYETPESRETFEQPVFYMHDDKIQIGTVEQVAEFRKRRARLHRAEAAIWPQALIGINVAGVVFMLWLWRVNHRARARVQRDYN